MQNNKKRQCIIGTIILSVVLISVGWHKLGPYHFKVVKKNVLYRGGSQEMYNLHYLQHKYDLKTIVSLRAKNEPGFRSDWYQKETDFCEDNDIQFYNIPMGGKEPPTDKQVKQWLGILNNESNYPVYVHCAQGVKRTGIMVALYEISINQKDPQMVWDELPRFGHDLDKESFQPLKDFVLNYSPNQNDMKQKVIQ